MHFQHEITHAIPDFTDLIYFTTVDPWVRFVFMREFYTGKTIRAIKIIKLSNMICKPALRIYLSVARVCNY